jgi:hypothetical protein
VVLRDRVGDGLQQHRLAGARRRDDEAALALAERRDEVDHAPTMCSGSSPAMLLVRVERRQVVEEDLVARSLGRFEVDGLDLDEREVALALLRRANLAGDVSPVRRSNLRICEGET